MKKKWFWRSLIVINILLLFYSFMTKNWLLSIATLILVLIIKHYAYDLLFKKFDDEWDQRHAEVKKRREQLLK